MMMDTPRRRPVVAILGGGLSGAITAFHLARAIAPGEAEIVVVEPRAALGGGLAYSTDEPAHRINVPASKMTIVSGEPDHFMDWLAAARVEMSPGTLTLRGDFFPERGIFGRYVAAHLAPLLERGDLRHRRTSAVALHRSGARWLVDLADGTTFGADLVVLAMSHPVPALPAPLRGLADWPRLVADPYDAARVARLADSRNLLVVGTGLTSADVVASLARRGHRGRIVALSRHGLRSRGHGVIARKSEADFAAAPATTALALLRRIRAALAADLARGESWRATLDRVRDQGQPIWAALPPAERGRLLRHLRAFWDVHRFRVAPQVEETLDGLVRAGRLDTIAARLVAARRVEEGVEVSWRRRGGAVTETATFDAVAVTTGPDHGSALRSNPVFRGLAAEGVIRPDPNGLGLLVADHCRAVDAADRPSASLFVVGPLARGHVGELMGVPEVTRHAEHVAAELRAGIAALASGAAVPAAG